MPVWRARYLSTLARLRVAALATTAAIAVSAAAQADLLDQMVRSTLTVDAATVWDTSATVVIGGAPEFSGIANSAPVTADVDPLTSMIHLTIDNLQQSTLILEFDQLVWRGDPMASIEDVFATGDLAQFVSSIGVDDHGFQLTTVPPPVDDEPEPEPLSLWLTIVPEEHSVSP